MHLHSESLIHTVHEAVGGQLISRAISATISGRCADGDSCLAKYHRPVLFRKTASLAWVLSGEGPGILDCTGTDASRRAAHCFSSP